MTDTTNINEANILIVDNDAANLSALFERLRQNNHEFFIARSAADALQQVERIRPNLILLNINLTDMDSFELCRRLKQSSTAGDASVVFLNALSDTAEKIKELGLSAVDYITTPFDPNETAALIDKHLTIFNLRRLEQQNTQLQQELEKCREAENTLEKFSQAVEQITDLVIITNVDGIIQYVNPAFERLTGYTRTEAVGQTPRLLKSGKHNHTFYEHLWQTILDGQIYRQVIENKKKDGSVYFEEKTITPFTDSRGQISHFVSTGKDVTDRIRAEQSLRQRTHELMLVNQAIESFTATLELDRILQTVLEAVHNMLDISGTSLWLRQPHSGHLVCRHAFGPGSNKIIGWQLAPGQGLTGYAADTGKIMVVNDTRMDPRHFKGVDRELQIEIRSLLNLPLKTKAEVIGVLNLVDEAPNRFTADDARLLEAVVAAAAAAIENARLYASIHESKTAAETANRAKSAFLANMSHELRTPLNGILGYAEILKQEPGMSESQKNGLNIIQKSGNHLLTLINDILDLSKIEADKIELYPEDVDLQEFVAGIVDIFRMKARQKGLEFVYQTDFSLDASVQLDPKRLRQVLLNLLGNAVKFTEQGQVLLTVKVADRDDSDGTKAGNSSQSSTTILHISVADTGSGISASQLETIFEPFEQAGDIRQRVAGAGLGLPISQRLVKLMGGLIQVNSKVGLGSTFWFEIPVNLAELDRQKTLPSSQQIVGIEGKAPKVLVVDDDWLSQTMLANLLTPVGFLLTEAKDGREGLLKALEFKPDVIITSLFMPDINGLELISQIRQTTALKNTVVVTTSARVCEEDRQQSLAAGSNDFIAKPIEADYLFKLLQQHLDLTWIYADSDRQPSDAATEEGPVMIPPPPDEMTALLELAAVGDVGAIQIYAVELAQSSEQYQLFAAHLQQLAESFQMNRLQSWLESFLEA